MCVTYVTRCSGNTPSADLVRPCARSSKRGGAKHRCWLKARNIFFILKLREFAVCLPNRWADEWVSWLLIEKKCNTVGIACATGEFVFRAQTNEPHPLLVGHASRIVSYMSPRVYHVQQPGKPLVVTLLRYFTRLYFSPISDLSHNVHPR